MISVDCLLSETARRDPAKTAVVSGDRRVSYEELDRLADHIANFLTDAGVVAGDRVVISLANTVENIAAVFGTLRAGAAFCPISPRARADKAAWIVDNCRPAAIIVDDKAFCAKDLIANERPWLRAVLDASSGSLVPPPACKRRLMIDDELSVKRLAGVIYTSGSTGRPKGVMHSHGAILAATHSITQYLELTSKDVILCVLPLVHSYGLTQVFTTIAVGATLVLGGSFAYPSEVLNTLRKEKVTGFPMVPTMAAMLARRQEIHGADHLRFITNAGAAIPVPHVRALRSLLPQARIYLMHGLTECIRTVYLDPDDVDRFPDSVGHAIPGVEIDVVGKDNQPVVPGEIGEMIVSGPTLMLGYWDDPLASKGTLRSGKDGRTWLHTGDLFRIDKEGRCYFVGRVDDIIKTHGEKVSPSEIENVIHELPGVRHALVVGVPDPYFGHVLMAIIVRWDDSCLTERDVFKHCAQRLEEFMVPAVVEFRTDLPVTDSNKILRRAVAEGLHDTAI